ncbi:hypothetical protein CC2G_011972 [Coprinopsis cinerea AmutBmut pab1-1]|nr:hypothetical protein CC2G_011972 [Coprinopsis cinerea AmutBmut pab1-1]
MRPCKRVSRVQFTAFFESPPQVAESEECGPPNFHLTSGSYILFTRLNYSIPSLLYLLATALQGTKPRNVPRLAPSFFLSTPSSKAARLVRRPRTHRLVPKFSMYPPKIRTPTSPDIVLRKIGPDILEFLLKNVLKVWLTTLQQIDHRSVSTLAS